MLQLSGESRPLAPLVVQPCSQEGGLECQRWCNLAVRKVLSANGGATLQSEDAMSTIGSVSLHSQGLDIKLMVQPCSQG